ncbi:MAG: helix-turn-helix domain-containing protein [Fibrobacteria bacterium]|nr:helix-turn-helix domain-containing protein [Fibrobacteria bacterium]
MPVKRAPPFPPEVKKAGTPGWFSLQLRHWRKERGLTQEAMSFAAELSTRHLSFLESGKARPSEEMIHRLLSVLDVPLEERNRLLAAEGFDAVYPEAGAIPSRAEGSLDLMFQNHEPFPMVVLSGSSMVLRANRAAREVFRAFSLEPNLLETPFDMVSLVLDPRLTRPYLPEFEDIALHVVHRLVHMALERPRNPIPRRLMDRALRFPGIAELWASRGREFHPEPATHVHLCRGGLELRFDTVMTMLSEPLEPRLQGMFIETYYPADETTRRNCQILADRSEERETQEV